LRPRRFWTIGSVRNLRLIPRPANGGTRKCGSGKERSVHELLKQFLIHLFQTIYALWTAPPEQTFELTAILIEQLLYLLTVFLLVRWMWRKLWK
jgi:hypothetical protein